LKIKDESQHPVAITVILPEEQPVQERRHGKRGNGQSFKGGLNKMIQKVMQGFVP